MQRPKGISCLIAAQNEEDILSPCIRSFLEFSDEIIIVSNLSTDGTVDAGKQLEKTFPDKVRFFVDDTLQDLWQNRQLALSKSRFSWIFRGDADFVATDKIVVFRDRVLSEKSRHPLKFRLNHVNLSGDFWHTGKDAGVDPRDLQYRTKYCPAPLPRTQGTLRLFSWIPPFKFCRVGRREKFFDKGYTEVEYKPPLYFHCSIKSEKNMFYRSERSNWREVGQFKRWPTLQSWVEYAIQVRYKVNSLEEAIWLYMHKVFFPCIQRYDPRKWGEYPQILVDQMLINPFYRIEYENGHPVRRVRV